VLDQQVYDVAADETGAAGDDRATCACWVQCSTIHAELLMRRGTWCAVPAVSSSSL
jgi:hypothetical protein